MTKSNENRNQITYQEIVQSNTSLDSLRNEKAVFISLDELNDEDFNKVKALIHSIDYAPLFVGHDKANC